jgi:hypothetical protein
LAEKQIELIQYSSKNESLWNNFVSQSKNGVFLLLRDYMEYHSDRFKDNSLMVLRDNQLVGLLPANIKEDTLFSHGGLTFGGLIVNLAVKTSAVLDIFSAVVNYCKSQGVKKLVYKAVPYIYHSVPASEDLYALFRFNAKLIGRNASSCIYLPAQAKFSSTRNSTIKQAKKNGVTVQPSNDFDSFMEIEAETLERRHGVKPVHSADEIKLLAERFPNNIKLFASFKNGVMLAGNIIYESKNVAHVQYAANSEEGWKIGAQDIIEDYLIKEYYKDKRYYDFGISTENQGQVLNLGLIGRKESFGASTVMYDIYQLDI